MIRLLSRWRTPTDRCPDGGHEGREDILVILCEHFLRAISRTHIHHCQAHGMSQLTCFE